MPAVADLPVAVIGAGGSGLLTAAALSRSGVAFELLEARDGLQRESAARSAERRRRDFGDRREYMLDHARYRALLRRDRRLSPAAPAGAR